MSEVLGRVLSRMVASALSKVSKEDLLKATGDFSFSKLDGKTFREILGQLSTSIVVSTITEMYLRRFKYPIINSLRNMNFDKVLEYLQKIRPDLVEAMKSDSKVYEYWSKEWEVLKEKIIEVVREA